ncbi:PB1 domain containing protein [Trema orientale]|uniref:PB1 domain containing protein n=1 Tax=Trema orientale TaxID=63057 RepID=A0A2P5EJS1_TREOI|nr:PB1 domain containing protein [Trema orientale]
MASHHPSELDSYATDSVASSPRSDAQPNDVHTRVRFMCSFGGKIVPRPHDNQLRYVGGDTRIVAVHRATNFSGLLTKLSKLSGTSDVIIKYQLPSEDLDALISVSTDEDVENMMDEYDRLVQNQNPKSTRLRIFLFSNGDDSRTSSISSLLQGSANRDNWFIDALNSGGAASGLERGRSEASSIVSEVPDYLFGLDNSDDPQARMEPKFKIRPVFQESVSVSDPGSPAPVVSSPFCSTSSVPSVQSIPNLPPVKTKPDSPINPIVESKVSSAETGEPPILQPVGYPGNPLVHYVTDPRYSGQPVHQLPVYYVPSSVPPGNVPIQHVPIRAPYVQVQQYPVVAGQIPLGYHHPVPGVDHLYGGGGLRPATSLDPRDVSGARLVPDGMNQQVLYGVRNNQVSAYPGMVAPAATGEDLRGSGPDVKTGKVNLSS